MKDLQGTQTAENLKIAYEAEATSLVKYKLFAADSDYESIEKSFKTIAKQEMEHAEVFLELLGGIGKDEDNLKNSIALEGFTSIVNYPNMAQVAEDEGFLEIAQKFRDIAKIEDRHKKIFEYFLNNLENNTLLKKSSSQKWMCMKCGFIMEGTEPPEHCPVCEHSRTHFELY